MYGDEETDQPHDFANAATSDTPSLVSISHVAAGPGRSSCGLTTARTVRTRAIPDTLAAARILCRTVSAYVWYRKIKASYVFTVTTGRSNGHRYTSYAGKTFERKCLGLADQTFATPARLWGEQPYANGGSKTSDIAVLFGDELVLFEANARRVGAEPLVGGDPLDATAELAKLIVMKINQLGVCIAALLDGHRGAARAGRRRRQAHLAARCRRWACLLDPDVVELPPRQA
jgi:hypothetical protein